MDIRKRNGKSGMTLIEILIVIALLGVLAGVLVKSLSSSLDSGKKASARLFCESTMGTAIASYKLMNDNTLPDSWDKLKSYIALDNETGTAPKDPDGNAYELKQVKLKTSSGSVEVPCVIVGYKEMKLEDVVQGASGADVAAIRTEAIKKVKAYNDNADGKNPGVVGIHF